MAENNETENRNLEQAENTRVPVPSPDERANQEVQSFGEKERENHRRRLFTAATVVSGLIVIALFVAFICWSTNENANNNWHIGLMYVLPAMTILINLLYVLKYTPPNNKQKETLYPFSQFEKSVEKIESIIKTIKG